MPMYRARSLVPSSPSARSTTWSWRTSALRRELWNGNSGQGASQVCHSPDPLPPWSAISAGVESGGAWHPAPGQLLRWDQFRDNAPAVGVPTMLQLGCQHRHDGRLTPRNCYHCCASGIRSAGPVRDSRSSRPHFLDWSLVISSFSDLGVPAAYTDRLTHQGITEPLTIQSETIPPALAGRDICGKAPTGSGKTLAFGIPLVVSSVQSRPCPPEGAGPRADVRAGYAGARCHRGPARA